MFYENTFCRRIFRNVSHERLDPDSVHLNIKINMKSESMGANNIFRSEVNQLLYNIL